MLIRYIVLDDDYDTVAVLQAILLLIYMYSTQLHVYACIDVYMSTCMCMAYRDLLNHT